MTLAPALPRCAAAPPAPPSHCAADPLRAIGPTPAEAAVAFVRTSAAQLRCGLRAADRRGDDGEALRRHDAAHDDWIRTIAAVRRSGDVEGAAHLAAVYALCGTVAGRLERGLDPRIDARVASSIRLLLAEHLQVRTEVCVRALRAAARG